MGMGLAMLAKALTNVHGETLVGRSRCTTGLDVANVAQVGLHRPRGAAGAPTRLHQHGTRWDRATAPRESRQADARTLRHNLLTSCSNRVTQGRWGLMIFVGWRPLVTNEEA